MSAVFQVQIAAELPDESLGKISLAWSDHFVNRETHVLSCLTEISLSTKNILILAFQKLKIYMYLVIHLAIKVCLRFGASLGPVLVVKNSKKTFRIEFISPANVTCILILTIIAE